MNLNQSKDNGMGQVEYVISPNQQNQPISTVHHRPQARQTNGRVVRSTSLPHQRQQSYDMNSQRNETLLNSIQAQNVPPTNNGQLNRNIHRPAQRIAEPASGNNRYQYVVRETECSVPANQGNWNPVSSANQRPFQTIQQVNVNNTGGSGIAAEQQYSMNGGAAHCNTSASNHNMQYPQMTSNFSNHGTASTDMFQRGNVDHIHRQTADTLTNCPNPIINSAGNNYAPGNVSGRQMNIGAVHNASVNRFPVRQNSYTQMNPAPAQNPSVNQQNLTRMKPPHYSQLGNLYSMTQTAASAFQSSSRMTHCAASTAGVGHMASAVGSQPTNSYNIYPNGQPNFASQRATAEMPRRASLPTGTSHNMYLDRQKLNFKVPPDLLHRIVQLIDDYNEQHGTGITNSYPTSNTYASNLGTQGLTSGNIVGNGNSVNVSLPGTVTMNYSIPSNGNAIFSACPTTSRFSNGSFDTTNLTASGGIGNAGRFPVRVNNVARGNETMNRQHVGNANPVYLTPHSTTNTASGPAVANIDTIDLTLPCETVNVSSFSPTASNFTASAPIPEAASLPVINQNTSNIVNQNVITGHFTTRSTNFTGGIARGVPVSTADATAYRPPHCVQSTVTAVPNPVTSAHSLNRSNSSKSHPVVATRLPQTTVYNPNTETPGTSSSLPNLSARVSCTKSTSSQQPIRNSNPTESQFKTPRATVPTKKVLDRSKESNSNVPKEPMVRRDLWDILRSPQVPDYLERDDTNNYTSQFWVGDPEEYKKEQEARRRLISSNSSNANESNNVTAQQTPDYSKILADSLPVSTLQKNFQNLMSAYSNITNYELAQQMLTNMPTQLQQQSMEPGSSTGNAQYTTCIAPPTSMQTECSNSVGQLYSVQNTISSGTIGTVTQTSPTESGNGNNLGLSRQMTTPSVLNPGQNSQPVLPTSLQSEYPNLNSQAASMQKSVSPRTIGAGMQSLPTGNRSGNNLGPVRQMTSQTIPTRSQNFQSTELPTSLQPEYPNSIYQTQSFQNSVSPERIGTVIQSLSTGNGSGNNVGRVRQMTIPTALNPSQNFQSVIPTSLSPECPNSIGQTVSTHCFSPGTINSTMQSQPAVDRSGYNLGTVRQMTTPTAVNPSQNFCSVPPTSLSPEYSNSIGQTECTQKSVSPRNITTGMQSVLTVNRNGNNLGPIRQMNTPTILNPSQNFQGNEMPASLQSEYPNSICQTESMQKSISPGTIGTGIQSLPTGFGSGNDLGPVRQLNTFTVPNPSQNFQSVSPISLRPEYPNLIGQSDSTQQSIQPGAIGTGMPSELTINRSGYDLGAVRQMTTATVPNSGQNFQSNELRTSMQPEYPNSIGQPESSQTSISPGTVATGMQSLLTGHRCTNNLGPVRQMSSPTVLNSSQNFQSNELPTSLQSEFPNSIGQSKFTQNSVSPGTTVTGMQPLLTGNRNGSNLGPVRQMTTPTVLNPSQNFQSMLLESPNSNDQTASMLKSVSPGSVGAGMQSLPTGNSSGNRLGPVRQMTTPTVPNPSQNFHSVLPASLSPNYPSSILQTESTQNSISPGTIGTGIQSLSTGNTSGSNLCTIERMAVLTVPDVASQNAQCANYQQNMLSAPGMASSISQEERNPKSSQMNSSVMLMKENERNKESYQVSPTRKSLDDKEKEETPHDPPGSLDNQMARSDSTDPNCKAPEIKIEGDVIDDIMPCIMDVYSLNEKNANDPEKSSPIKDEGSKMSQEYESGNKEFMEKQSLKGSLGPPDIWAASFNEEDDYKPLEGTFDQCINSMLESVDSLIDHGQHLNQNDVAENVSTAEDHTVVNDIKDLKISNISVKSNFNGEVAGSSVLENKFPDEEVKPSINPKSFALEIKLPIVDLTVSDDDDDIGSTKNGLKTADKEIISGLIKKESTEFGSQEAITDQNSKLDSQPSAEDTLNMNSCKDVKMVEMGKMEKSPVPSTMHKQDNALDNNAATVSSSISNMETQDHQEFMLNSSKIVEMHQPDVTECQTGAECEISSTEKESLSSTILDQSTQNLIVSNATSASESFTSMFESSIDPEFPTTSTLNTSSHDNTKHSTTITPSPQIANLLGSCNKSISPAVSIMKNSASDSMNCCTRQIPNPGTPTLADWLQSGNCASPVNKVCVNSNKMQAPSPPDNKTLITKCYSKNSSEVFSANPAGVSENDALQQSCIVDTITSVTAPESSKYTSQCQPVIAACDSTTRTLSTESLTFPGEDLPGADEDVGMLSESQTVPDSNSASAECSACVKMLDDVDDMRTKIKGDEIKIVTEDSIEKSAPPVAIREEIVQSSDVTEGVESLSKEVSAKQACQESFSSDNAENNNAPEIPPKLKVKPDLSKYRVGLSVPAVEGNTVTRRHSSELVINPRFSCENVDISSAKMNEKAGHSDWDLPESSDNMYERLCRSSSPVNTKLAGSVKSSPSHDQLMENVKFPMDMRTECKVFSKDQVLQRLKHIDRRFADSEIPNSNPVEMEVKSLAFPDRIESEGIGFPTTSMNMEPKEVQEFSDISDDETSNASLLSPRFARNSSDIVRHEGTGNIQNDVGQLDGSQRSLGMDYAEITISNDYEYAAASVLTETVNSICLNSSSSTPNEVQLHLSERTTHYDKDSGSQSGQSDKPNEMKDCHAKPFSRTEGGYRSLSTEFSDISDDEDTSKDETEDSSNFAGDNTRLQGPLLSILSARLSYSDKSDEFTTDGAESSTVDNDIPEDDAPLVIDTSIGEDVHINESTNGHNEITNQGKTPAEHHTLESCNSLCHEGSTEVKEPVFSPQTPSTPNSLNSVKYLINSPNSFQASWYTLPDENRKKSESDRKKQELVDDRRNIFDALTGIRSQQQGSNSKTSTSNVELSPLKNVGTTPSCQKLNDPQDQIDCSPQREHIPSDMINSRKNLLEEKEATKSVASIRKESNQTKLTEGETLTTPIPSILQNDTNAMALNTLQEETVRRMPECFATMTTSASTTKIDGAPLQTNQKELKQKMGEAMSVSPVTIPFNKEAKKSSRPEFRFSQVASASVEAHSTGSNEVSTDSKSINSVSFGSNKDLLSKNHATGSPLGGGKTLRGQPPVETSGNAIETNIKRVEKTLQNDALPSSGVKEFESSVAAKVAKSFSTPTASQFKKVFTHVSGSEYESISSDEEYGYAASQNKDPRTILSSSDPVYLKKKRHRSVKLRKHVSGNNTNSCRKKLAFPRHSSSIDKADKDKADFVVADESTPNIKKTDAKAINESYRLLISKMGNEKILPKGTQGGGLYASNMKGKLILPSSQSAVQIRSASQDSPKYSNPISKNKSNSPSSCAQVDLNVKKSKVSKPSCVKSDSVTKTKSTSSKFSHHSEIDVEIDVLPKLVSKPRIKRSITQQSSSKEILPSSRLNKVGTEKSKLQRADKLKIGVKTKAIAPKIQCIVSESTEKSSPSCSPSDTDTSDSRAPPKLLNLPAIAAKGYDSPSKSSRHCMTDVEKAKLELTNSCKNNKPIKGILKHPPILTSTSDMDLLTGSSDDSKTSTGNDSGRQSYEYLKSGIKKRKSLSGMSSDSLKAKRIAPKSSDRERLEAKGKSSNTFHRSKYDWEKKKQKTVARRIPNGDKMQSGRTIQNSGFSDSGKDFKSDRSHKYPKSMLEKNHPPRKRHRSENERISEHQLGGSDVKFTFKMNRDVEKAKRKGNEVDEIIDLCDSSDDCSKKNEEVESSAQRRSKRKHYNPYLESLKKNKHKDSLEDDVVSTFIKKREGYSKYMKESSASRKNYHYYDPAMHKTKFGPRKSNLRLVSDSDSETDVASSSTSSGPKFKKSKLGREMKFMEKSPYDRMTVEQRFNSLMVEKRKSDDNRENEARKMKHHSVVSDSPNRFSDYSPMKRRPVTLKGTIRTASGEYQWYTTEICKLKPCFVVIRKLNIKKRTIKIHRPR